MKWIKRILLVLAVGFCLYYLVQQPEGAAAAVKQVFNAVVKAFSAIGTFFNSLAS